MPHIDHEESHLLYHGTLSRNIQSIRANGLTPQKGLWVGRFHEDAAPLVYAVDDEHRSAATLAIIGQMGTARLTKWSADYSFDGFKSDLIEHGAIVIVKALGFRRYPWREESGHPNGAEPGNWYSSETVKSEGEMIGEEMVAWLRPGKEDFCYRYRCQAAWN